MAEQTRPGPGETVLQSGHVAKRPDLVEPSACRFCAVPEREHLQRWMDGVGWHVWTEPTQEQRRERMLDRSALRSNEKGTQQ